MDLYKANLLQIKFHRHLSRWMYVRLANAATLYFLWFEITWRMPWLPKAIYMQGWNACWRELYYSGRIKPFDDLAPTFRFGKPPEDDAETTLRFTKFVSGQTDEL